MLGTANASALHDLIGSEIEYGENANGQYVRSQSGLQICWFQASGSEANDVTVLLPANFIDNSYSIVGMTSGGASTAVAMPRLGGRTTSAVTFRISSSSDARVNANATFIAIGRWF
jgi:hypothetical protein